MSRHNITYKPGGAIARDVGLTIRMQKTPASPEPAPTETEPCEVNAEALWFIRTDDTNVFDRTTSASSVEGSTFFFMAGLVGEYCQCNHPDWDETTMGPWVRWELGQVSGSELYGFIGLCIDKDTVCVYSENAPGPGPIEYRLTPYVGGIDLAPITLTIFGTG